MSDDSVSESPSTYMAEESVSNGADGSEEPKRGSLPSDWELAEIDEITEIIKDGGTPDRSGDNGYFGGDINWAVVKDVEYKLSDTREKLTSDGLDNCSSRLWPEGSVILTTGATIGKVGIAQKPTATKQGICGISPDRSKINNHFLARYLESKKLLLNRYSQGSTIKETRPPILKRIKIPVPSLGEQERIASVLYSVDEHVRTLDDRHNTLTDHKQALMQDLFLGRTYIDGSVPVTDGIPGNGAKLNGQEFPDDWSIETLGNVCEVNVPVENESQKVDYLPMDSLSETVPWPQYTKTRNPQENSGTYFRESDTLIAKITPSTENGKSAFIEDVESKFGIASTEVISLTPTDVNPKFLYYYVNSHPAKGYAVSQMRGTSGRQRVPTTVFKKELKIPIPSRRKQERIASVLYTVDEMIARTASLRDEYERLKQGLMQDLLSGDVRTPTSLGTLEKVRKSSEGGESA